MKEEPLSETWYSQGKRREQGDWKDMMALKASVQSWFMPCPPPTHRPYEITRPGLMMGGAFRKSHGRGEQSSCRKLVADEEDYDTAYPAQSAFCAQ